MLKYKNAICIFEKYTHVGLILLNRFHKYFCLFNKLQFFQNNLPLMSSPIIYLSNNTQQVRNIKKHWNPNFRTQRIQEFIKIKIPNCAGNKELTPDEVRTKMKEHGLLPCKSWNENPILISCTTSIFEPYIIPKGDGKFSSTTTEVYNMSISNIRSLGNVK